MRSFQPQRWIVVITIATIKKRSRIMIVSESDTTATYGLQLPASRISALIAG